jgi:predicted ATPase
MAPDRLKAATSDALMKIVETLSAKQPLLVVIEDVHWIDPSTFEFLQGVMQRLRGAPILLVLTVRTEAAGRSRGTGEQMIDIPLSRLSAAESAQIVGQISSHAIPQPVVDEMVAKSDGVPLFLEEVTRSILATGARLSATVAVPASLHDSLVARLDNLSSVKRLAQFAAALGRSFSRSLFEALAPFTPAEIEAGLGQLTAAGLLLLSDSDGERVYLFKHALLQDAAYQSLLKGARRKYHQQIAEGLARKFPHSAVNDPELLAHHFTEAGDVEQAIDYWMKAGKRAKERSANAEAAAHFERGLQLVETLGEGKQKAALEFALHVGSIAPLTALKGYASPEVERAFGRALELSPQVPESAETFTALSARLSYLLVSGQIDRARLYNQENVRLAERLNDRGSLITAYRGLGVVHLLSGKAEEARPQLERALSLYDPEQHRKLAFVLGQDARVTGLSYLVLVLWHLGRIEEAARCHTEALEAVRELGHHNSTGLALTYAGAFFHALCRDGAAVQRHAERLIQLGDEHKLPLWSATGRFYLGLANAEQQRHERGIALMCEGLDALRRIQVRLFRPAYLTSLSQAYIKIGQLDEARACLSEADELATTGGERWFFAEQLRTHGEIELKAGNAGEAERRFQAAYDLACEQRSKSLELRAATSLGGLLLRQGKGQAARALLAPVCNAFAESLTLLDLKDARAVLRDTAPPM